MHFDSASASASAMSVPSVTERFPARRRRWVTASSVLLALTVATAGPAGAQAGGPATTVDQPRIVPTEFNGDVRSLPKLPVGAVAPKFYRPLMKGPTGTKSGGGAQLNAPGAPPGPQCADAFADTELCRPEFQ